MTYRARYHDGGFNARSAVTRAVNRAIARDEPIFTEQPTLRCLKDRADAAGEAFDAACKPHYVDGRWGAYRAIECNQAVPPACVLCGA